MTQPYQQFLKARAHPASMSAAWLKGSIHRAVASSPALSSAVAKASTAAGSAYDLVAPTLVKAAGVVTERLLGRQELTAAVRQAHRAAGNAPR